MGFRLKIAAESPAATVATVGASEMASTGCSLIDLPVGYEVLLAEARGPEDIVRHTFNG